MALNPNTKWPGRITAPAAGYPYGSSKDETAPGANDGTPYEKARADDIFGMQQAILESLAIVPSGNAETSLVSQYLQGLVQYSAGKASYYDDSGAADAYVVDPIGIQYVPDAYFAGEEVWFIPDNDSTGGAATADVNSRGTKSIKTRAGNDPAAGEVSAGSLVGLKYDGTNLVLLTESPTDEGYVHLQHQEASGVAAGASSTTTFNKRLINTEVEDDANLVTLSSGVITLQPGTYRCLILTQVFNAVGKTQTRLRNTSDSNTPVLGLSMTNSSAESSAVNAAGKFTIAAAKDFEVQTYTQTAVATNGLGNFSSSGEVEVYADIQLWKIA